MTRSVALSANARAAVVDAVHRALGEVCLDLSEPPLREHPGGLADLDAHVDDLIEIVRHTSADRIEPYLVQILEQICVKCAHQAPSMACGLRHRDLCVLYRHAGTIVRAVEAALKGPQDDPRRNADDACGT